MEAERRTYNRRKAEDQRGDQNRTGGTAGKIPGLVEIKVQIEGLESSNADLMLDSTFTDEEALKGYSVHPAHVEVADTKVRPFTQIRLCLDFNQ